MSSDRKDEITPIITVPINLPGEVRERFSMISCSATLGEMVTSAKKWVCINGVEQLTVREARGLIEECDIRLADLEEITRALINVKKELRL